MAKKPRKPSGATAAPAVEPPPKRRLFFAIAMGGSFIAIAASLFAVFVSRKPAQPNDIILITVDTLRADSVGYANAKPVKTPFLDSLAKRGIAFTNAHAHNVVTLPSHANILTGLLPYQHGVRDNAGFTLDAKYPTLGTILRNQGWATGAFVGAYPLDSRFGLNQGFDLYDDNYGKGAANMNFVVQERRAPAVLESAAKWWRGQQGRKRFMWIHVYDPHAPYTPPPQFAQQYGRDRYLGEVAATDHALGEALNPILSESPNTLVIVTSDHGEGLGEHGELTHGLFAYEPTLKVPLVLAGPGVKPRSEAGYVAHIDIAPTVLAAIGMEVPKEWKGRSLLGEIGARDTYFESLSASLNRGWAPLTGVIHEGQKYIDLPIAELYDLPLDPGEVKNLRQEKRREVEAARKILAGIVTTAEPPKRSISPEEMARLRSLGYFAGSEGPKKVYTEADDPKNLISVNDKIHRIIELFETGDTRGAAALAKAVVDERPNMVAGRELYAFMLQEQGEFDAAIVELKKIIALGSASEDTKAKLALLLSQRGRAQEAVQLLGSPDNTTNPEVLNAFGVALADEGKLDQAAAQFQKVLAADPNNAPAVQNLGIVALRRNDIRTAHDYLVRALELNPNLPLALNSLGVVYARTNNLQRAVEMWKRAVNLDPHQYDALYNIGLVEGRAGNREEARRALTRFVETAPPAQYAQDIATARQALLALR